MSKAFFYARNRALLVSRWPVVSDAAVALTTRMLAAAKTGLTRAEAHRQAMMAMIDSGPAHNAHPALWAPFVVVGEEGKCFEGSKISRNNQMKFHRFMEVRYTSGIAALFEAAFLVWGPLSASSIMLTV